MDKKNKKIDGLIKKGKVLAAYSLVKENPSKYPDMQTPEEFCYYCRFLRVHFTPGELIGGEINFL